MRELILLWGVATLAAQPVARPGTPRFEVVSIRPVPPNAPATMREVDFTPVLPGGQYVDSRTNLWSMIAFAYHVEDAYVRLVGLPKWAQERLFAVAAKPAADFPTLPPSENREQVRAMLRAMLEDRFHLQLHTEEREERILSLEVAKGGMKIREVDAPMPPDKEGLVGASVGDSGGRMIGKKSTMAGVAKALMIFVKRPVVDHTGLKGYYDFNLKWAAPEGTAERSALGPDGIALLFAMLQDQLGLRVRAITAPLEYWVADRVEPPTDN